MKFLRSEDALQACSEHLAKLADPDPQIEAILTAYVSSVIYAEFEDAVVRVVAKRAGSEAADKHAGSYATISAKRLVRSIKIGELAGLAGYFHASCKEKFQVDLDEPIKAAWDSICNNRHNVAHEQNSGTISNLTFSELQVQFEEAKKALDLFEQALNTGKI